jgi:phosphoglycolate phosphatase-like HAD superfamily hydrolase
MSVSKKIKAVVFDFDGTLVDTFPKSVEILNSLAQEYGYSKVRIDDVDELRRLSTKQLLGLFDIPLLKLPFVLRRVQKELHQVITNLKPVRGLPKVLEQLHDKGFVLGIVSSNIEDSILDFLHRYKLNMFNFVYGGVIPYTKQFTFKKMFDEQRIDPERTIYVGDEVRDVKASQKVDIPVVCVDWGFSTAEVLEESEPDFLISRPRELLGVLGV